MSRKYLYLFGLLLGLVFSVTPILFGLRVKSLTIQYAEKMMTGEMETRSALITEAIRNMILGGDIISARAQLEIYKERGYITGYQIIKADQLVESSAASSALESYLVAAQNIYFSKGSPSWGVVKLYYSKNMLLMLQQAIRSVFFEKAWQMAFLLLLIMSVGFYVFWRTSGDVIKILDKYIVDFNVPETGRFFRKLWGPLLRTLRQSGSEYKRIRQESEQLKKHEAVAQTAQHLAHDLKGPIGVMATVLHASNWENFTAALSTYRSALFRLQTMVGSLKAAAVNDIIRDSWCSFSLDRVINEFKIAHNTINIELLEHLPHQIRIDSAKLERAVSNLIINAIEAGATKITCRQEVVASDLVIEVSDNGPGVPEGIVNRLFERGVTYGKNAGSGLGLAYVAQVARGHGGDVVYARKDNLTKFSFIIPNVISDPMENAFDSAASLVESIKNDPSSAATSRGARPRCLLLFLKNKKRQEEIAAGLSRSELILLTNTTGLNEASLVYTDDFDLIDSCLRQNVRFISDGSFPVSVIVAKLQSELLLD